MTKPTLIYVLAASHSGSTLSALLIGAHPKACTVGELKLNAIDDVDRYLCSCKTPILQCEFWSTVRSELSAQGVEFDLSSPNMDFYLGQSKWMELTERPLRRGHLFELFRHVMLSTSSRWRKHIRNTQARNLALIRTILNVMGATAIVDSSKIGSRLDHLLDNDELDVFVVRVVRDGRAVSLTYMDPESFADASNPEFRGGGKGLPRDAEIKTMEGAAEEWRRSNEEAEAILRKVRTEKKIQIRYEDLCTDPLTELNRIFIKSGLGALQRLPDFRSKNAHVVGNGMRMDSTQDIILDDRWRTELTIEQLKCFERIAGTLNRRLGYS